MAFLYGRLWPNEEKALQHAVLSTPGSITAEAVLDPTNKAQGMPRKTRSFVWQWLTR